MVINSNCHRRLHFSHCCAMYKFLVKKIAELAETKSLRKKRKFNKGCISDFPFNVDITGADTIIVEADATVSGGNFEYGLVS